MDLHVQDYIYMHGIKVSLQLVKFWSTALSVWCTYSYIYVLKCMKIDGLPVYFNYQIAANVGGHYIWWSLYLVV